MLSDTCCEAVGQLTDAVAENASAGYSLEHMRKLVSATFLIGRVESDLLWREFPEMDHSDEAQSERARRYVLRMLLTDDRPADMGQAIPLLAQLAEILPELRQSIHELYTWSQTPEATAQALRGRFSAEHVGPLYRMVFEHDAAT